jgi:2-keto-3-deoxy-L-rhamnonate aldolase RhmA
LSDHVVLTFWTSDPDTARVADLAGIDRIGVDLDRLGKQARQAGLGTWVSRHTVEDLVRLRPAITRAQLFVRSNPLHDGTPGEVERALAAGAEVLMLPMFRSAGELARYVELVGGRARVVGLLETAEAVAEVEAVARVAGLDELHVGINDLALALGLPNRFWVLLDPAAAHVARAAAAVGLPLGVGGIGRVTDAALPIPPDLIYAQYPRLGATAALISRSFLATDCDVATEVRRTRERLAWWAGRPRAELDRAARALGAALSAIGTF